MNQGYRKYRPFQPIALADRTWPGRTLTQAPVWCSVDLRDGNQALVTPMNLEQKVAFFRMLTAIGFREIEVGFPASSETEFEILRTLIEGDLIPEGVTIQVLVQAREHLIRRTFQAIRGARDVIVHFYNSTSTLQRKVVFETDMQGVIDIAVEGARLIRALTEDMLRQEPGMSIRYEYSPESFSGTEVENSVGICDQVLEALGGWNTSTIAEDAEFSAQCARLGYRVHWVYDALTYDEAPTSFLLSLRQRKRWCSGVMQVARQELGKLWEDYSPRPMLRWDMTMFLLAPFSQAVSGILLGVNAALHLSSLLSMVPLVLLGLCLAYTGTAALGVALCLLGGYGLRGMGKTVLVFPIFMASWLPLQVISLFRDTKKWHAIQHTGRQVAAGYRA